MSQIAILITHGTDTLAWTHAFVRYAIKRNKINIAMTGSQNPLPSLPNFSDAYINIANSVHFLTNIVPPNIFTVFNYGAQAFSDSLSKYDRWNNNAFAGDRIASMEWDEIKEADKAINITDRPVTIDKLYLITTGGTIAAAFNEKNALAPARTNVIAEFIQHQLDSAVRNIEVREALVVDSSDMTFDKMEVIVNKVMDCIHENGTTETFADFSFDRNVRIVYTDPFKTVSDYRREIEGASGIVIAGYGGGNINIEKDSGCSPLTLIQELCANNIPIVLSSQVALGTADFIYENGRIAIEAGAMSGVDLSLPEIQLRMAYLLGHRPEIEAYAQRVNLPFLNLFDHLFISGMKFRTRKSKAMYTALKGFDPCKEDLLINRTIEESLSKVIV
ncbi:MAG: asparaginase domain-containing protein [Tannerella sp.]|jgi:L-asparaginase/Glu-tRNA(Gln) amidotransferase subunit D|nr:asparaginase domain-containing protein [Tannerella sp.]